MTKVLVLDDDPGVRTLIVRLLGCLKDIDDITEVENGRAGLAAVQRNHYNLIITDNNMPVMDGLGFLKQTATIDVPKVLASGRAHQELYLQARLYKASGVLYKPFTHTLFTDVAQELLATGTSPTLDAYHKEQGWEV